MEFKQLLNGYTSEEFKGLVSAIWNADMDNDAHARLIDHFDTVVGHPLGADLIFYPPDADTGNVHSVDNVIFHVRQWHNKNGNAAFKGDAALVAIEKPTVRLSPQERKVAESTKDLGRTQQMAADIEAAGYSAHRALMHFSQLMDQWQASPLDARGIPRHINEIADLESAQSQAVFSVRAFEALAMRLQFAKSAAERNVTSSFRSREIQARVLELINQAVGQYEAAQADILSLNVQLHTRATPLFAEAEQHIVRMLALPGAVQPSRSVHVSLRAARQRPCLMFTIDTMRIDEHNVIRVKQAIRSAVAEFSWQAASITQEHPGTFSGVVTFCFDHWKRRDWYALSIPLSELVPLEGYDWTHLALTSAEIDLPYRLFSRVAPPPQLKFSIGLKEITEFEQVCLTPTGGDVVSSKVSVRSVEWDHMSGAFSFRLSDTVPVTIVWLDSSGGLSNFGSTAAPEKGPRGGMLSIPKTPLLESFGSMSEIPFEDCVLVFPPESGIEPLYLMFKGGR